MVVGVVVAFSEVLALHGEYGGGDSDTYGYKRVVVNGPRVSGVVNRGYTIFAGRGRCY